MFKYSNTPIDKQFTQKTKESFFSYKKYKEKYLKLSNAEKL